MDTISTADRCLLLLRSIQSTLHLQLIDRFMRSSKTIHIVSCHAEGEVVDVIVGGTGPHVANIAEITGRAWITETHLYIFDPDNPWPQG